MGARIASLFDGWKAFQSSSWYRAFQIAIIALSVGLMLRALLSPLSQIAVADLHVDMVALLSGLLLTWIAFGLGTLAWAEIVQALQPEVRYSRAIKYHLLSVVAKYLPGVGWQQVSKAVQLHRDGVPLSQTWLPVSLELGLTLLTGVATALQTLSSTQRTISRMEFGREVYWAAALLFWVICATMPLAAWKLANPRPLAPDVIRKFVFHLYLAELLDVVGWLLFGAALWSIAQGVASLPLEVLPYCIVVLALSVIVGLVVVIVPNGYGVRELTMSTLLQTILPLPVSIIVALLSRVVLVAAEFLGVLPLILISLRRWRK